MCLQPEVPELVSEHSLDSVGRESLEQRVEKHDALVAADAGEIRIAVRERRESVDHKDAP